MTPIRYDNIQRVMLKSENFATIIMPPTLEKSLNVVNFKDHEISFVADLSETESMYAIERYIKYQGRYRSLLSVHVHSSKQIEGGAWDEGKFGKGITRIIE